MQYKKNIITKSSTLLILIILFTANISIAENQDDSITTENVEYHALLIGSNYLTGGRLPYSDQQLMGFKTTLLYGGNWQESNIKILLNSDVTRTNIFNGIHWLANQTDENDISIFYFIGHGGQDSTNEYIKAEDELIFDTELDQRLSNVSGKIIVIIDACFSGGFIEELGKPGRIILTACDKNEKTYQITTLESGLYGFFLNMSFSWLAKNAEIAYFTTRLLINQYTKSFNEEHNENITIHPQMYDGISQYTKVINSHRYVRKCILIFLDSIKDISKENSIWHMEEKMNN